MWRAKIYKCQWMDGWTESDLNQYTLHLEVFVVSLIESQGEKV